MYTGLALHGLGFRTLYVPVPVPVPVAKGTSPPPGTRRCTTGCS
ncbi:hypothetical protein QBC98_002791 [Kitasatospora acidiphila]